MLNKEAILKGTPRKTLMQKFSTLRENLTKSGAFEYYLIYSEMKLSDILSNFELIYKEPHKGTGFIHSIIAKNRISPYWYDIIHDDVRNYLSEKKDMMSAKQYGILRQLETIASEQAFYFRKLSSIYILTGDEEDFEPEFSLDSEMFNNRYIYDTTNNSDDKLIAIQNMQEIINQSDIEMIIPNMYCCVDIPELIPSLSRYIRRLFDDTETPYGIQKAIKAQCVINKIYSIPCINKMINMQNDNFKFLVAKYADNSTLIDIVKGIISPIKEELPQYSSISNAINNIYDLDELNDLYEDEDRAAKIELLEKEKAALTEISNSYISDSLSHSEEELDEMYDESIVNLYGGEESVSLESANSGYDRLIGIINARIDAIDSELYLEYANNGNATPIVKKEMGIHHDNKDDEPKKPKQSVNRKIQTKAMDANFKSKKVGATVKRGMQEVRNTAKAIKKIPDNISKSVDSKIKEWDDMDDDRRKKYILEAGFRKRYFKLFKLCLSHYIAFAINPIMNIVLFICQKLSSEKDSRIKNELATELESEIKICEEKIADANSKGDNDKKYKLMRIKDKLQNELTRVKTNSKYV